MTKPEKKETPAPERMLYKEGAALKVDGEMFDYIIVLESDVEEHLADGWFKTTQEALGDEGPNSGPTREELETKANELEIKFRSNTSDKTLLARIEEALEAKEKEAD